MSILKLVMSRLQRRVGILGAATLIMLGGSAYSTSAQETALRAGARIMTPGEIYDLYRDKSWQWKSGAGYMKDSGRRFSAWIDDDSSGARYWRIGAYLDDVVVVDSVAPGIDFVFIHRPLSRYVHAMGQAGLLIEDMVEPPPPARLLAEVWPFPEAASIPRLVLLRARHAA